MRTYRAVLFDLFGTLVNERGDAMPGAESLLNSLSAGSWAVVTSCPRALAHALFVRARLPEPELLVSSDDVARGKPAPDCYLLAAERLGKSAEDCLVVEDSRHGIAAAAAAGMDAINVNEVALRDLVLVQEKTEIRVVLRR